MIEKIVMDYINDNSDVPAFLEIKGTYPDIQTPGNVRAFYLIEKTGGNETETIKKSTLAIQSWAGSMYEAASNSRKLIEILKGIIANERVIFISLNSEYNYTDTRTKYYRYQAVFDITHY